MTKPTTKTMTKTMTKTTTKPTASRVTRRLALTTTLTLTLALAACDKKDPQTPAPTDSPEAKAPPSAPPSPSSPKAPDAQGSAQAADQDQAPSAQDQGQTLDEAAVLAVVQTWLKAQNDGDFQAYAATFAAKMTGVKRVADRTYSFNRQGWLKDRERMFKKKMIVTQDDLKVSRAGQMAVVTFTQTWASGSFKDVGPKQLVIVQEGDALKIAREELLSSTLDAAAPRSPAYSPAEFAFTRELAQGGLGLDIGPAPKALHTGRATLIKPDGAASKAVHEAKLPPEALALKGVTFAIYGPQGQVCQGQITGFVARFHVTPHFGQRQSWEEDKASDRRVAAELWALGGDAEARLTATLDVRGQDCPDAVFARSAQLKPPVLYTKLSAEAAQAQGPSLAQAYRASPSFKSRERDWTKAREQDPELAPWWDGTFEELHAFAHPTQQDQRVYAVVGGDHTCGASVEGFWHIFTARADVMQDALSPAPSTSFPFWPTLVVDVDADGNPELLTKHQMMRLVGPRYELVVDQEPLYLDCPC